MSRRPLFLALLLLLPLGFLFASPTSPRMVRVPNLNCTPDDLSYLLPKGFEPSDAVYNSETRKFTLVSDDSRLLDIASESPSTQGLHLTTVGTESDSYDLEGIALVPHLRDKVYLGSERPAAIIEFDTRSGKILDKWPLPMKGRKKNKGLEALLYLPTGNKNGEGYLVAGLQEDASMRLFKFPPKDHDLQHVATLLNPPGPGDDLSALALRSKDGRVYMVFDKHLEVVAWDLRKVLERLKLIPIPMFTKDEEVKEFDLGELAADMATQRYKLPVRGVEALAFSDTTREEMVLMGIDAPKKSGGRKAVWTMGGGMFDRCFASGKKDSDEE